MREPEPLTRLLVLKEDGDHLVPAGLHGRMERAQRERNDVVEGDEDESGPSLSHGETVAPEDMDLTTTNAS